MTSLKDEEVLDTQEQFESKSYKSKRFKKWLNCETYSQNKEIKKDHQIWWSFLL
jgi:hypothetical protein